MTIEATKPIIGRTPAERITTSAGRVYTWGDESFPSVTTILGGGIPKPALVPWAIRSVAEAAVAMTRTGQLAALLNASPDAALAKLKSAPYDQRDKAATLGSAVHEAAEAYILGTPHVPSDPAVLPYLAQFHRFVEAEQPEYLAAECTVYHRACGYAGTLDAIVRLRGKTWIMDYKTGAGVYPEAALQLAAYRYAEFVGLPDGTETPLPEIDGALVLHLQKDGYRLIPVNADNIAMGYFLDARRIWEWVGEIGKGALQEALS